ncbi:MAG: hypothetical protein IJW01_07655 [Paludibacteraceae bacterium]|jgi:hypothetical protein|nr:hypothetical protein [Paludibacteraceae bacterium]
MILIAIIFWVIIIFSVLGFILKIIELIREKPSNKTATFPEPLKSLLGSDNTIHNITITINTEQESDKNSEFDTQKID